VRVQAAAGPVPSHRVDLVRLHAQTVVVFPSGPTWDHVLLSLHGIRVEQVWNGVLRRGFAFRGEDHDKVAAALTAVGVDVVDDIMAAEWAAADAAAAAVAAAGHAHGKRGALAVSTPPSAQTTTTVHGPPACCHLRHTLTLDGTPLPAPAHAHAHAHQVLMLDARTGTTHPPSASGDRVVRTYEPQPSAGRQAGLR
jgi:hypothetical protein